jgi:hypothetical protein
MQRASFTEEALSNYLIFNKYFPSQGMRANLAALL